MAATDRKRTGDKSILPPTKAEQEIKAMSKEGSAAKKVTETQLADIGRTITLFVERRVMDDIDRFIGDGFNTAKLGHKKLLRSPSTGYICEYSEAEHVPGLPGSVCVKLTSLNLGSTVVSVCATWDKREFNWSKEKTRWLIKTRIIEAVERLEKEHNQFFTDAAVKIVKTEHEKDKEGDDGNAK